MNAAALCLLGCSIPLSCSEIARDREDNREWADLASQASNSMDAAKAQPERNIRWAEASNAAHGRRCTDASDFSHASF